MKLLVGLGNPGDKYARNRHNVGFMALDAIADRHRFSPWKKRFQGLSCDGEIGGERALLLKPETYMNESGRAVGEAMRFLKIGLADLVVLHDELDLEPGRLKAKSGGGNAGHNGLRSITAHVGNEYLRVRIGIGHPGHKDAVATYVLHDFAKAELAWLQPMLDAMADKAGALLAGKPDAFVSDVARLTRAEPEREPAAKDRARSEPKPAPATGGGGGRHPAGERAAKQKTALADNLKTWLAAKAARDAKSD